MTETQQQKYIGSFLQRTKSFLVTNYQKLPLKAPKFVENVVVYADTLTQPLVDKATNIIDENINRSVQIIQSYEKSLNITQQSSKLKQKGKEITDHLKENSKKAIDQGVNLAVKNGATQYVINTCDNVVNKIFTSVETHVVKLQKIVLKNKQQQEPKKTYNQRTVQLAYNMAEITQGLIILLKNKVAEKQSFLLYQFQIRKLGVIHTFQVVYYQPFFKFFTNRFTELKSLLTLLKEKIQNRQLFAYLYEQLTTLKQQVDDFEQFKSLLFQVLAHLNLYKIVTEYYQLTIDTYYNSFTEENQQEQQVQQQQEQQNEQQNDEQTESRETAQEEQSQ